MLKSKKIFTFMFVLLISALILSACSTSPSADSVGTVAVGSKDFTEQFIVAEMYAQLLENEGFTVERKIQSGRNSHCS